MPRDPDLVFERPSSSSNFDHILVCVCKNHLFRTTLPVHPVSTSPAKTQDKKQRRPHINQSLSFVITSNFGTCSRDIIKSIIYVSARFGLTPGEELGRLHGSGQAAAKLACGVCGMEGLLRGASMVPKVNGWKHFGLRHRARSHPGGMA
jgi:hypothetical protein